MDDKKVNSEIFAAWVIVQVQRQVQERPPNHHDDNTF
jgi:hypothetical protein